MRSSCGAWPMATTTCIALVIGLMISLLSVAGADHDHHSTGGGHRPWSRSGPKPSVKSGYLQLHFYLQEQLNDTFFLTVPPPAGVKPGSFFGATLATDHAVTAGPDASSTLLARAKGLVVASNKDPPLVLPQPGADIVVVSTVVFTEASGYGGSTVNFLGFDAGPLRRRELSIVGGTGLFRLARGWVEYTTLADNGKGRATLDMTAHIYHGPK